MAHCWLSSGGHGGVVYDARFRADGRQVLTASMAGTARWWHADAEGLLEAARKRLPKLMAEDLASYGSLLTPSGSDGNPGR